MVYEWEYRLFSESRNPVTRVTSEDGVTTVMFREDIEIELGNLPLESRPIVRGVSICYPLLFHNFSRCF